MSSPQRGSGTQQEHPVPVGAMASHPVGDEAGKHCGVDHFESSLHYGVRSFRGLLAELADDAHPLEGP